MQMDIGMLLGGFGLFMFGIKFMGDGLKSVCGDKLREYIDKYTSNRFSALIIGIILTIILQSSSATSAIAIGLVRAGLMTFVQACGVILGASVGTTVTSFLISINIEKYAMFIVFAGAALICFTSKQKTKHMGEVVLGFGLIFFGMAAMGDQLAQLKTMPAFTDFALKMSSNPWLAMLTGVLLTAAVQSSAATIGVAQKLYAAGAITFSASIPFMFGASVGTTMTGILASIGGTSSGKKTAAFHLIINIVGATLGMLAITPFCALIQTLFGGLNPMMQIAMANIVYKIIATTILFPFVPAIVSGIDKVLGGKEGEHMEVDIDELDTNIATLLPSAAIKASSDAMMKMIDLVKENINQTRLYLNKPGNEQDAENIHRNEGMINKFDKKITDYLIDVSVSPNMTPHDINDVRINLNTAKNLERLGDLATNLLEFYQMVEADKNADFSEKAIHDINKMYDQFVIMVDLTAEIFITRSEGSFNILSGYEDKMDKFHDQARDSHFTRMSTGECDSAVAESVFCDVLATIERMGDHCMNIARDSVFGRVVDTSEEEEVAIA